MEQQADQVDQINRMLMKHFHLSRDHQERQGQLRKQTHRENSQENDQPRIDTDEDLQQHSDLLHKTLCADELLKGKIIMSQELEAEGVQVFSFTKEPSQYTSLLQILSNRVHRSLCLWKGRVVVLQKQKGNYMIRSTKPLDRLLKIELDHENNKQLVMVYVNKHQNQFCSPNIKKLYFQERNKILQHLQSIVSLQIARMQGHVSASGEIFTIT